MSLTLITGPANSAKAQEILRRYRLALARTEPILVVPTPADAEEYRRELAAVEPFGVRVELFSGLQRELALRCGPGVAVVSGAAREQLAVAALERVRPRALARPAASPRFAQTLCELFGELSSINCDPATFSAALRAWGRRRRVCEELSRLYAEYRAALDALGVCDPERAAALAIDGLRGEQRRWRNTPVFLYGFDDLTPVQLETVKALARAAPVCVSLPFEAGRTAFAGRAFTWAELSGLADEQIQLEARAEHYAPASRAALHRLERELFEPPAAAPLDAGPAIALLEGGGERAQCELVGSAVLELLSDGYAAHEIAVAVRGDARLLEQVFAEQGVPWTREQSRSFGRSPLGRALLSGLRAALPTGSAQDLLDWLRAPGMVKLPELLDQFEATLRRRSIATAQEAAAAWTHWPLERLVQLRGEKGRQAHLAAVERELNTLMSAPGLRQAEPLRDAAAAAAGLRALRELRGLGGSGRGAALLPTPAGLIELLSALPVREPARSEPGRVLVCDPLSLRARRVRALVLCGLEEGAMPAPERSDPFFSAAERAEIRKASGLALPFRPHDTLAAERYLFYALVSRPEERLLLAWRSCTDTGEDMRASPFLEDLMLHLRPGTHRRRMLGQVDWEAGASAPGPRAAARAEAAAAPVRRCEHALQSLSEPPPPVAAWSASALERYLECPVRWFAERRLRAADLSPDPDHMERGNLAHAVLERVLSSGVHPAAIARPAESLREALGELTEQSKLPAPERRRLQADLERYLEQAAAWGSEYVPSHLELDFDAVEVAPGLRLRGRIDRIDQAADGRRAIIYDYKGASAPAQAKWLADGRLQMGLYMLVAQQLLGVEVVGGFYQALRGKLETRGALLADADPGAQAKKNDRLSAEELDALLSAVRSLAEQAAAQAAAGQLTPRPATCGFAGAGCSYPSLCRSEPAGEE